MQHVTILILVSQARDYYNSMRSRTIPYIDILSLSLSLSLLTATQPAYP